MIHTLILKVAQRCNLNCSYCYMYQHGDATYLNRPRFMDIDVFEATLNRAREYCECLDGHKMSLVFHGGEPLTVGVERFCHMLEGARRILSDRLLEVCVQTNGVLVNDLWVEVFRRFGVRVGVSLDGPAEIHDRRRVDHAGRGSHAQTVKAIKRLQEAGVLRTVLCVIDPTVSGLSVYRHIRSLDIRTFDFLFPDFTHDSMPKLRGNPIAQYLIPVFDEWYGEDNPTIEVSIFTNILSMMLGSRSTSDAFGNLPLGYVIIESDGGIQALDTLRICKPGLQESNLSVHRDSLHKLDRGSPLLLQLIHDGLPLCEKCQECRLVDICGGGYPPHRYSLKREFNNPSIWCDDIIMLLDHIYARTGIKPPQNRRHSESAGVLC